jgi:hypothetical protein
MTDLDTGKTVSLQELMVSTLKIQGRYIEEIHFGPEVTEVVRGSFSLVQFRENLPAKSRFRRAF